ncbi:tRNA dihydrouridine synthase DusB [bacterium]|nr:tRNA dihydrouridine synthase DusB [bacterium]
MERQTKVQNLIQSRVSLAPMAGITDYVIRSLIRRYSPDVLLTTEMISSEFLAQTLNGRSGTEIFKKDDNHSPIAYQISGHKPQMMKKASEFLTQYADMIDINMGCPVNKVVKGQDGCALMRNPQLATELVKAVKDGTDKPVSVKFRLGYTFDEMNFVEFGVKMQEAGANFITIHGRTRSQMYAGNADWARISELKKEVDIPVFANGDIIDIDSAARCLELSHADGIAVGRGAIGDPTLLGRISHYLKTGEKLEKPNLEIRAEMLKKHLDDEIELRGESVAIKFMRKFYPYYLAGFQNAKTLRTKLVLEDDYNTIIKLLDDLKAIKI